MTVAPGAPPRIEGVPVPTRELPEITEVKRTLAGGEKRFVCRILSREPSHLAVLFIAPAAMHVHGVDLPAGTVTFGHFWSDRPYNVYHWLEPRGGTTIGYYLNLSAETRWTSDLLQWLDLTVDVLALPDREPVVLDEDEIPADLSPDLRRAVDQARATTLRDLPQTIAALERYRDSRWQWLHAAAGEQEDKES